MKKRNVQVHLLYSLLIGLILAVSAVIILFMRNKQIKLIEKSEQTEQLDRAQLVGTLGQAEGALRMAAHTESPAVYAEKMQLLAESTAAAALLTEQHDPASAWMILWMRLSDFAEGEIKRVIGQNEVSADPAQLDLYADLLEGLKQSPEALEGPLWELPEGLGLPTLQTEFSIGEEQLKESAAQKLNIGEDLLKKADSGLAGIVRYRCSNAEIDLLISGELVYLDLQLPRREGNIGRTEGVRRLREFAGQEGYPSTQVVDLYEHEGVLWAKMVPTVDLPPFGAVKNLDRPIIAALTLWSGRICHFEVKAAEGIAEHGVGSSLESTAGLLSEQKMKRIAEKRNALLGEAVICKGKLCRTLIVENNEEENHENGDNENGSAIYLYLDASNGSERGIELRYPPRPVDLPTSAEWGIEPDSRYLPMYEQLPPYGQWQLRRYQSAYLAGEGKEGDKSV